MRGNISNSTLKNPNTRSAPTFSSSTRITSYNVCYTKLLRTITQDRIDRFAEVTGDVQWIHVDPARAAKESPYGTTIAHGYLTLSLLPFLTESNHP